MNSINILQAMSSFSRLVEAIEQGQEQEVVIAKDGRPVAKLVPMGNPRSPHRRGAFDLPAEIQVSSEEVANLFLGEWEQESIRVYRH
ncbi:MAG: type II toxin-antitoxin system Phd/YefM family antitoxin [Betaproteobacteria bacterium]